MHKPMLDPIVGSLTRRWDYPEIDISEKDILYGFLIRYIFFPEKNYCCTLVKF